MSHEIHVVYPSGKSDIIKAQNNPDKTKKIAKLRALYGDDVSIKTKDGRRL